MGFTIYHDSFLCVWKMTSIHLHINIMCLRLHAKYEGVLQDSTLKIQ